MRRLSSPRKVWKLFITSLQTQLHKLNRSKAIVKKPPLTKTRKRVPWPPFSFKSRPKRQRFLFKLPPKLHHQRHLRKGPSPVYIDQLFLESNHLEGFSKDMAAARLTKRSNVDMITGSSNRHGITIESTSSSADDMSGQRSLHGGGIESPHTADDMWESLLLSSPQMHGINERAEEFIARFRAEMQLQEMLSN